MRKLYCFSTELAMRYGLEEAIMLERLADRLDNAADPDMVVSHNGHWLKLTYRQLNADLPFFSLFKIRKCIDMLQGLKLIFLSEQEDVEVLKKRRTLYIALTEKGYELTHAEQRFSEKGV